MLSVGGALVIKTPGMGLPVSASNTMPLIVVSTKSGVVGLSAHEPKPNKPVMLAKQINIFV